MYQQLRCLRQIANLIVIVSVIMFLKYIQKSKWDQSSQLRCNRARCQVHNRQVPVQPVGAV